MNANPMEGSQGSTYVMGRTSEEYERLRRQSELLESATASVLDRAGLCPGMSCLDVGCGPGEVMRLMAERVGLWPLLVSAWKQKPVTCKP